MNEQLSLESKYQITSCSQIDAYEIERLIALYQPMIGYEATSLYLTLWSEIKINKQKQTINYLKRIIKIMNIDLRLLISSFSILEAIGLIKTYYHSQQNSYIINLLAPEKAHLFFQNPLFIARLKDSLNEDNLLKSKEYFDNQTLNLDGYKNITKNYKEVFSLNTANLQAFDQISLNDEQTKITSDLDLDLMKSILKPYQLHYHLLENRIIQTLEMLYLTYNVTTNELVNAIIEVEHDDEINLDELVETVKLIDKLKKTPSSLDLIFLRNNEGATLYEKYSVVDYLKKNYSYFNLSQSLYLQLETIMKNYSINNGVMNIMIEVCIKQTQAININYLEAIAREWSNAQIDNVTKAQARLNSINDKQRKKATYHKQRSIGSTQDWNKVEEKELSKDELKEMDAIIKKMKGE